MDTADAVQLAAEHDRLLARLTMHGTHLAIQVEQLERVVRLMEEEEPDGPRP